MSVSNKQKINYYDIHLLHRRFSHTNINAIRLIDKHKLADDILLLSFPDIPICEICLMGKNDKAKFSKQIRK